MKIILLLLLLKLIITKIEFFGVMPHGVIALNHFIERNLNSSQREKCNILIREQYNINSILKRINPDLILLSTPHGISDQK
jgi:hypothetical protein